MSEDYLNSDKTGTSVVDITTPDNSAAFLGGFSQCAKGAQDFAQSSGSNDAVVAGNRGVSIYNASLSNYNQDVRVE